MSVKRVIKTVVSVGMAFAILVSVAPSYTEACSTNAEK